MRGWWDPFQKIDNDGDDNRWFPLSQRLWCRRLRPFRQVALVADIRLGVSYAEFNMVTSDTLVRAFFWFLASERFSDTRA